MEQDRQCTYNVTQLRVRVTMVAVGTQQCIVLLSISTLSNTLYCITMLLWQIHFTGNIANFTNKLYSPANLHFSHTLHTGWGKIPSYFQQGIVKGGVAVEGWGWARKVQVVGKFPLQHSAVVKMVWSNEQRAFNVETYFSQSHSIVVVQRAFRTRYQIPPRDRVLDRKSILLWVENFTETGSVSEKR